LNKRSDVKDEKDFLLITTSTPKVICHFYHPDFRRCSLMTKHLETLAEKHFTTKFIKLQAEKAPFLVERLKVGDY
jgi:hypothetical protein